MKSFILLLALIPFSLSADECKKLVFNQFCLGGDAHTLLSEHKPQRTKKTGQSKRHFYKNNGNTVIVQEFQGRVMVVNRLTPKPSWLKYQNTLAQLKDIYGEPSKDASYFPIDGLSDFDKGLSIKQGKARAMHIWDQGSWEVGMVWSNRLALGIRYIDKVLKKTFDQSNNEGL